MVSPVSERTVRAGRRDERIWRYCAYTAGLLGAFAAWNLVDDAASHRMFLINRSPSLPNWAFVVERGGIPQRGGVSFFRPPHNRMVDAHFGKAPAPFGKYAYGVAGDVVERVANRVLIRARGTGRAIEVGRLKPTTMQGEPLAAGQTGVIPEGCYYMGSPHKDGFDSRYAAIGFVCAKQIVGTASRAIL